MIFELSERFHSSHGAVQHVLVLKFGSSLLKGIEDVARVCDEIGRLSASNKLVVVVSAFKGETDRLFALASQVSGSPCATILPKLILSGEEQAACAVALACAERGLRTDLLPIADLEFFASGDPFASTPRRLDPWPLTKALRSHDVVVVPGFGARCADTGKHVLLGRGGSDLTATMIAAALRLSRVRLLKDVGGIYTRDPNQHAAQRINRLDWKQARMVAGKLVQAEAIDCAERYNVAIEVAALGSETPSVIGPAQLMREGQR